MKTNIYPWHKGVWEGLAGRLERLPHAILVHGPQGVGKLALAERLAQSLLCESAEPARVPCGECEGCRWFHAGSHPDFRRVEPDALAPKPESGDEDGATASAGRSGKPSTEIRVEQIRALEGFLALRSHRGRRRVALVRPAEDMNQNAANALLKSLEEPPLGAFFVLVSHRPGRLLATVRSRCLALPVVLPERTVARAWLEAQGARDADWALAYASGAPLQALALAEHAGAIGAIRRAAESGDLEALRGVNDRESLEALAEALQKYALDRAFASLGGRGKYGPVRASGSGLAWLRYARAMGRNRALARHPLNPRLFAGEMLAGMPKG